MPNHKQIRWRAVPDHHHQEALKQPLRCGDDQQTSTFNATTTFSLSVNIDTTPSSPLSRLVDQEREKTANDLNTLVHRRREMSPDTKSTTKASNTRGASPKRPKESTKGISGRSSQGNYSSSSHGLMIDVPVDKARAATRETTTYDSVGQEKAVDTGAVSFDSSADDHQHKDARNKQVDNLVPKTVTVKKESEMNVGSSSNVADDAAELALVSGDPSESERSETEFHSVSAAQDVEINRNFGFLAATHSKSAFRLEKTASTSVTIEEEVDENANSDFKKRQSLRSDDISIAESISCRTCNRSSFATGTAVKKLCEKRGCWITGEVADCEVALSAMCRVQFNVEGSTEESFRIRSTPKDLDLLEKMVKLGRVRTGARVNLFRSEEHLLCPATVLQERPHHMKAFFVQYEDGESEWINLWFHRFEVLADAPSRKKTKSSSIKTLENHSKYIKIKEEEREKASKESQRSHGKIETGESKGTIAVPLEEVQSPWYSKPIEKFLEDEGTDSYLENAHDADEIVDSGKDEATSFHVERKHLKRKRDSEDAFLVEIKEVDVRKKSSQEDKGADNHLARTARQGKTNTSRVRSKASVEASNAADDGKESTECKENSSEGLGVVVRDSLVSINTEKKTVNEVDSGSDVVDSTPPEKSTKSRAKVEQSAPRLCGTDFSHDGGLEVDVKEYHEYQEADREVAVGDRVGIYWGGDKRYYYGKVTRHEKGKKKPFFLEYDDGESEWVDFSKSKYRFEKKKVADRTKVADKSTTSFDFTDKTIPGQSKADALLPQPSVRTTRRSLYTIVVDVDARLKPAVVSDGVPATRKKLKVSKDTNSDIRNSELTQIKVGTRVAVWWPDDRRYYEGVVSKKQSEASWRPFYLEYDDGEAEWIDFRQHKFKILRIDEEEKDASHSARKAADPCSDPSKVWIGTRLSVWWPQEEEYFDCTVTRYRDHKRPFYLEYEDGDREWIDLAEHKFFIIDNETSSQRRTSKRVRSR